MSLAVRDLTVSLGDFVLDVSLDAGSRTTALYGPSGAGKTTLLETVAGLRRPRSGSITLDGRLLSSSSVFVAPRERRVGYVPQDNVLFPHLTVRQNVVFGGRTRFDAVVDVLELRPLLDRGARRLSGGEQKRVALARALCLDPRLLLLDEPLAGVDVALRDRILAYLQRIRDEFRIPTLYVTHQMEEVQAVCEEIVLMESGRVVGRRVVS